MKQQSVEFITALTAISGLCIVIFISHLDEESNRHTESQNFRRKDGQPDSVETEKQRQQKERRDLKQQRPQERDRCGDRTVVQRRKESGAVNIEAVYQERQTVETESVICHGLEFRVISHEKLRQRSGAGLRQYQHGNPEKSHDTQAAP